MGMKGKPPSNKVIEPACCFPRFIQADRQSAVGEPGEGRAPRQTLQIDHPIKTALPSPQYTAPKLAPVYRRRPALSLETDEARQVRISFQEWSKPGVNPPIDLAIREVPLERAQYGQRLNDVTQGAGLEN